MATKLAIPVADFRTTLATEIAVGGTTATLQSNLDEDGVILPTGKYFFTLDGNGTAKEHIVCTNTGGSLTLITSISRQGVQTAGVARKHRVGASTEMTDFAHINYLNDLLKGTTALDATTPLGYDGVASITTNNQLATKVYVDNVALAGAPDATTANKGVVQVATGAQLASGTAIGSTGASIVPNGGSFKDISAGVGDANKVPVLSSTGVLDQSFLGGTRTWPDVQTLTADNLQITTDPNSANDAVRSSYLDAQLEAKIPEGAISGTSGEAITAGQGVYIRASDGRVWRTIGTADEATFNFVGIALSTVAGSGFAITYASPGHRVSGFVGLTAGSYYFISDVAGTLALTPGSRFARVGLAVSTTQMLVTLPKYVRKGSFSYIHSSGSPLPTQVVGFLAANIHINAVIETGSHILSVGTGHGNGCICLIAGGGSAPSNNDWSLTWNSVSGGTNLGSVGVITASGFTPTHSSQFNIGTMTVQWRAESL